MAESIDAFIIPGIIMWWKTERSILLDSDDVVIRRKFAYVSFGDTTKLNLIELNWTFDLVWCAFTFCEFDFVQWPNNIEFNRSIEFDWVRKPNVRFDTPGVSNHDITKGIQKIRMSHHSNNATCDVPTFYTYRTQTNHC